MKIAHCQSDGVRFWGTIFFNQNEIHRTFKPKCTSDYNGIELEKFNGSIEQSSPQLCVLRLAKAARDCWLTFAARC